MLYGHEALGLKGILLYGDEGQKRKYLPKLTKGEWIATLCLSENDFGLDIKTISTRARLSDDGLTWKLSGKKKWVINAPIANVFTVLAAVQVQDRVGRRHDTLGVFIVEKNFGGITIGNPEEKLGRRASTLCEVTFEDTAVPVENVLGEIGLGFQIAVDILIADQFSAGSTTAGLLKNLINSSVEFSENRDRLGKPALEYLMTRINLPEVSSSIYAMESMSYITAGILDHHHNADCSVEAAMIKVFSSENLRHNVNEFQAVFGNSSFIEGFEYERLFRDSRTTMLPVEENDMSRLFIALAGLQHAGISLHETVKKLRNPLFYPGFLIKKIFQTRDQEKDKPKLLTKVENLVHPNLQVEGEHLEYSVQRLKYATEILLTRYGQEVTNSEMELCKLADVAINIFAMAAVIARASHSSSVGLQNFEIEMVMAKMFCSSALQEVRSKVQDIIDGPVLTNIFNYQKIAKKVFKSKGYFPQHPLTRNF
ncbi:complex I assembly factor ACAD9, mitochondrial isoform X2 [Anabrus simplex]